MKTDKNISLPDNGRIFILTGKNGSGKTRTLEKFSADSLESLHSPESKISRLICLSGTVIDKFPSSKNDDLEGDRYIYLGRKTASNMFSEISPYRRLSDFLFEISNEHELRSSVAMAMLKSISLGSKIDFKFRSGRNKKDTTSKTSSSTNNISFDLNAPLKDKINFKEKLKQIRNGDIHINNVSFEKDSKPIELANLSSGERSYALTILSLAFTSIDNSLIIFDEPENSLHPSWQSSIIKDMLSTVDRVSKNSTILIATHSPLIISGAINKETHILDLERDSAWSLSEMYGNTSDSILKEQFGLSSPRSIEFLSEIRRCLRDMVSINSDPNAFLNSSKNLLEKFPNLSKEDPLYQTLNDIKEARENIQ